MRGSSLRAGIALMALMSANTASSQMYYPEDYAIPPAPILRRGPPMFDPRDDYPPMGPYFGPRFRERFGARMAPRQIPDEPSRYRARRIDPPVEERGAPARSDQARPARAPAPAQESKSRTTTRPVTARNDSPPARVEATPPAPPLPPPRPVAPQQAARPSPVAVGMTTTRPPEPTATTGSAAPQDASGFVNKGEAKLNQ